MRRTQAYILAALAAALTLSLVFFPDASLEAAKSGLNLFLTVVFPSLLPFFILSEIMLGTGVVHFIGVLFEPLMRPLFNVPGEGAFALSMGLAAGYPMDAVITARFRNMNLCNRVEGERLLAFTNTADPLFIFGAVAVGMFGMPALGGVLALAHYLSALSVGLVFRFYGRRTPPSTHEPAKRSGNIISRAAAALVKAREEDGRPLGKLAGDSVNESVRTLLMICGFIMLFSAFVSIAGKIGLAQALGLPFAAVFKLVGLSPDLVSAAVSGIFEIDIGTLAASTAAAPFVQKALMAGAIIAWSGLSVHGQVASVITGTDIRMGPYFVARALHAVFAAVFTALLIPPMLGTALATGAGSVPGPGPFAGMAAGSLFLWCLGRSGLLALGVPLGMTLAGVVAGLFSVPIIPVGFNAPAGGRRSRPAPRSGRAGQSRPATRSGLATRMGRMGRRTADPGQ